MSRALLLLFSCFISSRFFYICSFFCWNFFQQQKIIRLQIQILLLKYLSVDVGSLLNFTVVVLYSISLFTCCVHHQQYWYVFHFLLLRFFFKFYLLLLAGCLSRWYCFAKWVYNFFFKLCFCPLTMTWYPEVITAKMIKINFSTGLIWIEGNEQNMISLLCCFYIWFLL